MKEVFQELLPPDLPAVARYRLAVFLTLVFLMGSSLIGWRDFARAADVQTLRTEVKNIQLDLLEQRIYDTQRLWCGTNTAESRRFYRKQIDEMHRTYFAYTGITVNVPTCSELGLGPN